jgi:hypothetical protein
MSGMVAVECLIIVEEVAFRDLKRVSIKNKKKLEWLNGLYQSAVEIGVLEVDHMLPFVVNVWYLPAVCLP